jgi:hypothetical protein
MNPEVGNGSAELRRLWLFFQGFPAVLFRGDSLRKNCAMTAPIIQIADVAAPNLLKTSWLWNSCLPVEPLLLVGLAGNR